MTLLRRHIRCNYCNVQSRDRVSQMPHQYLCPHCDALNYFDRVSTRLHPVTT
jgi:phage FluMu protein Com